MLHSQLDRLRIFNLNTAANKMFAAEIVSYFRICLSK